MNEVRSATVTIVVGTDKGDEVLEIVLREKEDRLAFAHRVRAELYELLDAIHDF